MGELTSEPHARRGKTLDVASWDLLARRLRTLVVACDGIYSLGE